MKLKLVFSISRPLSARLFIWLSWFLLMLLSMCAEIKFCCRSLHFCFFLSLRSFEFSNGEHPILWRTIVLHFAFIFICVFSDGFGLTPTWYGWKCWVFYHFFFYFSRSSFSIFHPWRAQQSPEKWTTHQYFISVVHQTDSISLTRIMIIAFNFFRIFRCCFAVWQAIATSGWTLMSLHAHSRISRQCEMKISF